MTCGVTASTQRDAQRRRRSRNDLMSGRPAGEDATGEDVSTMCGGLPMPADRCHRVRLHVKTPQTSSYAALFPADRVVYAWVRMRKVHGRYHAHGPCDRVLHRSASMLLSTVVPSPLLQHLYFVVAACVVLQGWHGCNIRSAWEGRCHDGGSLGQRQHVVAILERGGRDPCLPLHSW